MTEDIYFGETIESGNLDFLRKEISYLGHAREKFSQFFRSLESDLPYDQKVLIDLFGQEVEKQIILSEEKIMKMSEILLEKFGQDLSLSEWEAINKIHIGDKRHTEWLSQFNKSIANIKKSKDFDPQVKKLLAEYSEEMRKKVNLCNDVLERVFNFVLNHTQESTRWNNILSLEEVEELNEIRKDSKSLGSLIDTIDVIEFNANFDAQIKVLMVALDRTAMGLLKLISEALDSFIKIASKQI